MKLAKRITALAAIGMILIGGMLEIAGSAHAKPAIFLGALVLILVYIPLFLFYISKKWDDEDNQSTANPHNQ